MSIMMLQEEGDLEIDHISGWPVEVVRSPE
jgi:hypothetical protein